MIIQKYLFHPGFFLSLRLKRETLLFSLPPQKRKRHSGLKQKFTKNESGKIPRDSFINCLRNAAQQFVEKRGGKTLIIAGYHGFGAWGRIFYFHFRGWLLARHGLVLYREVLDTQINKMKDGLFQIWVVQVTRHLIL